LSLLDATILLNSNYHPLPPLLVVGMQPIVYPLDNAQFVHQILILELYAEYKIPQLLILLLSQQQQHLSHLLLIIVVLIILI